MHGEDHHPTAYRINAMFEDVLNNAEGFALFLELIMNFTGRIWISAHKKFAISMEPDKAINSSVRVI